MKKLLFSLSFLPALLFAQGTYYFGTEGLSGYALKTKLYEIISKSNYNWNYDSDLRDIYATTDVDKYYENNNTFLDIYSENPTGPDKKEFSTLDTQVFSYPIVGTGAAGEGSALNREHIVPQATFNSDYPMYSDVHFVIPADAKINQLRNYYPYGISKTNASELYYTFSNSSKIGNRLNPGTEYRGRVYEPIPEFRGDIARMILYFVVRYESKLSSFKSEIYYSTATQNATTDVSFLDGTLERSLDPWFLQQLLQWNVQDPVSQREIDRNNEVYNIQKNRNPFIDHPEWVDLIWNQTVDSVVPNAPTNLTFTQNGANFITVNWFPSVSTDVIGYKVYVDGVLVGSTKTSDFTLDHLSASTSYNITVKAYDNGYLLSSDSNVISASTLASDSYAKDLMITKYIEGTTNSNSKIFNNAIEITNNTGHAVNLNNYKLNIQTYDYSTGNYYFSDSYELEGTAAPGETFVVMNPEASLPCYSVSQAKFVTAAPPMMYTGTQYIELAYKSTAVDVVGTKDMLNANNNVSLYRLTSVTQPTTTFNLSEWQSYSMNYCTNLGTLAAHDVVITGNEIRLYPNPVSEGNLFAKGEDVQKISKAQIYDVSGKLISEENSPFKTKKSIDVSQLKAGVYLLVLDGKSFRFIKK